MHYDVIQYFPNDGTRLALRVASCPNIVWAERIAEHLEEEARQNKRPDQFMVVESNNQ